MESLRACGIAQAMPASSHKYCRLGEEYLIPCLTNSLMKSAVADVEFRAWGQELAKVFISADEATMNVMIENLNSIEPQQHRPIISGNEAPHMLLFGFLQELIYYKDSAQLMQRATKAIIW